MEQCEKFSVLEQHEFNFGFDALLNVFKLTAGCRSWSSSTRAGVEPAKVK